MEVAGCTNLAGVFNDSVSGVSNWGGPVGPETIGSVYTNQNSPHSKTLRFEGRSTVGQFLQWLRPKSQADGHHCPGNAYQTLLSGKFKFPLAPLPCQVEHCAGTRREGFYT